MITSHNRHMSNSLQHQSIQRKPPTPLNGSRLKSLLIEGGNPGVERIISKVPQNSGALTLDRIRGTSAAPPLSLAPKKRRRRRNMEPGSRECHICGEIASSHSYYGAQVRYPENMTCTEHTHGTYSITLVSYKINYKRLCLSFRE